MSEPRGGADKITGKLRRLGYNFLKKLDPLLAAKTSKLEGKHKIVICLAAWLIPVAVFALLLFMPKMDEISDLQAQISRQEIEVARLQATARQIDRHRAEVAEVEQQLQVATQMLPKEREIPSLLTSISNLGTGAGLDFLLFRPRNEVVREFYADIPVDISIAGSYHDVGVFLDQISKLPRIVTVNNINMGSPTRDDNAMRLNTTFSLLTYRFIEPEPEAEE